MTENEFIHIVPQLRQIALQTSQGYGKLLNADEKKFCATSLNKMKKDTDDDYLQSLLELTANSLRK